MNPFTYTRAQDAGTALKELAGQPGTRLLAGGTNLIDLMKMGVETPSRLVDLKSLPLAQIEELEGGSKLRLGAMARNADVAEHPLVRQRFPVLSQALLAGASPQLRNLATMGGNLLQRTRCPYFYDPDFPACNKRKPGSGCGAIQGFNRNHAILGHSLACIATHPSDLCVGLAVLDPFVQASGPKGQRSIPFADFHRLPGDQPELDTTLQRDELITSIDLPALPSGARSGYLKIRDRASYAFALVSAAVVVELQGETIKSARIALGGVAHKPWRCRLAEGKLAGASIKDEHQLRAAAESELTAARSFPHNKFKVELAQRAIVRALQDAAA